MAGVETGSTVLKGFMGTTSLPIVTYSNVTMPDGTIRDVVVTLQGHHVIPQKSFEHAFFEALKIDRTFDGNSFAQNGAPLATDKTGATIVGGSTHRGPHKAYSDWVNQSLAPDKTFFESAAYQNMSTADQKTWRDGAASRVQGFMAYAKKELMDPSSTLSIDMKDTDPNTSLADLPEQYKAQFQSRTAAVIEADPAYKIGSA